MALPDRLRRAERELEAARRDLDQGFWEQACGHAYYAAFYAAQEALTAAGETAKTHTGTSRVFREVLEREGLDTEAGRELSRLQTLREDSTYRFVDVPRGDAEDAIAKAERVIAAAKDLVQHLE